MITSNQISGILEDYLKAVSSGWDSAPIYLNPTSTDFKELYKDSKSHEIRFFIDNKSKKVYAWNGERALHGIVAREIGVFDRYNKIHPEELLSGYAEIRNGKGYMLGSDTLETTIGVVKGKLREPDDVTFLTKILNTDWSWAYRYVDCSDYLRRTKSEVKL
jgi:hypothetical protein